MVTVFDRKYTEVLDNPACQTSSAVGQTNSPCRQQGLIFTPKDSDFAISGVNDALVWDRVHSNHLKIAGLVFRNLCKFYNKMLSHFYIPHFMLKER